MTLLDTLAELPDGQRASGMTWDVVARYIRTNYTHNDTEKQRRAKAARRHRFYMSGGDQDMAVFIRSVIEDKTVKRKRLEFIEHAKFNNIMRRVVHEMATVYALPALRTVKNGNDNYQALLRDVRMDEVMHRANRLAILHRNVAIGPRIRNVGGRIEPVLDVVTPDKFFAVHHPNDPLSLVALVFDVDSKPIDKSVTAPAYVVWSDTEWLYMDGAGNRLSEPVAHGYGFLPWLLFSIEPASASLLDTTTGDDLEAAHRTTWFINILLIKEAKSYTVQHVIQGDASRITREQAADSDVPIEVGEGASITTIDNKMDLGTFITTARSIYETAAANYGLPPSILSHAGTQSADARELMRVPLREIRLQQQIPFRIAERVLVEMMAAVIGSKVAEYAYDPSGFAVDFADPQTPLGTKESLEVFKQERELGLTSTIAEVMRRNPDIDRTTAIQNMERWNEDETERIRMGVEKMRLQGAAASGTRDEVAANDAAVQMAATDGAA